MKSAWRQLKVVKKRKERQGVLTRAMADAAALEEKRQARGKREVLETATRLEKLAMGRFTGDVAVFVQLKTTAAVLRQAVAAK